MKPTNKYKFYAVDDFANDEAFWLWVVEEEPEQVAFWTSFLEENPEKRADIEKARDLILKLHKSENKLEADRVTELWQRIENTRSTLLEQKEHHVLHPVKSRYWFNIAAVLTFLCLSTAVYWFLLRTPTYITLTTAYGKRQEFVLPDGSKVFLNANSNLKYAEDWGVTQDREVWLTGEGFFSVMPKENKQAFILHASSAKVKVLGTSFNVNNRRKKVKVLLYTGKISLGLPHLIEKPLLLKPNDFVTYEEGKAEYSKTVVNPEVYLAWRKNLLQFEAETLENIFLLLQDQYQLHIKTDDPAILKKKFTGTVPANDLSVLFTGLSEGYNLEITQTGNQVFIKNKAPLIY